MIGQIVQRLYDNGFFVTYTFTDVLPDRHYFRFWKMYKGEQCRATYMISDIDIKMLHTKDNIFEEIEGRMAQIDSMVAQRKQEAV